MIFFRLKLESLRILALYSAAALFNLKINKGGFRFGEGVVCSVLIISKNRCCIIVEVGVLSVFVKIKTNKDN